jgi:xanthine dehydrogenase accessory factor
MTTDRDIMLSAAKLAEAGEPFVLITVIRTQGSTPRDAGAKMIYRNPSPEGTVGGGQFELLVLDAAEKHLENRTCGIEKYVLGADADQCCGGVMEVFFESFGARQRLVIFGAGHVSHAMAQILATAPLELVIVDDRAEWNSQERFPRARRVPAWDEGVAICQKNPATTLTCVMTCSHDTDFELLRQILSKQLPAFVGLIGSKSKRVCLFGRLVASGIDEAIVQKVHCPIGVGDTGKEPGLVAISIAAQVLLEGKKHAAR